MIQLYKKNGLIIYWLILLIECYDAAYNRAEYSYYIKGLEFLSIVLYLSVNLNKRHHLTSRRIIYSALITQLIGSYLIIANSFESIVLGYAFYGIACILLALFMYRLTRRQETSTREPIVVGLIAVIAAIILFVKTKVEYPPYTYLAYLYAIILILMLMASVNLLGVSNKRSIAFKSLIPATVILMAAGVLQILHHFGGEKSGLSVLSTVILICYGSALPIFIDGAKKILK